MSDGLLENRRILAQNVSVRLCHSVRLTSKSRQPSYGSLKRKIAVPPEVAGVVYGSKFALEPTVIVESEADICQRKDEGLRVVFSDIRVAILMPSD
ncbi:MAG: hypothetical protein GY947_05100 [Rhodobacteraceae bacterium]|nr:hypothetical protein [Paracoccaceae bacterium]